MKQIKSYLLCSRCFKNSPVRITYFPDSRIRLVCLRCGYTTEISSRSFSPFFLHHLEKRILTKPLRMAVELKKDSLAFLSTLPLRVITKPVRLIREIEKTLS